MVKHHKPKAGDRFAQTLNNYRGSYWFRLLVGLVIAGAVLWLSLWLASEVFEGETVAFDETVRQSLHQMASPIITSAMIGISFVGSPGFLIGLGTILVGAFLYLGRKRAAILFLIAMAGEVVLDLI